jgi:hypothetical protein
LHRATGRFPVIGKTIFHYHILAKLGGGTGVVYRVQIGMASLQGLLIDSSVSSIPDARSGLSGIDADNV